MRKVQKISKTPAKRIYKFRANSKKTQQVNPSPFKSAQVPWTYFLSFKLAMITNKWYFILTFLIFGAHKSFFVGPLITLIWTSGDFCPLFWNIFSGSRTLHRRLPLRLHHTQIFQEDRHRVQPTILRLTLRATSSRPYLLKSLSVRLTRDGFFLQILRIFRRQILSTPANTGKSFRVHLRNSRSLHEWCFNDYDDYSTVNCSHRIRLRSSCHCVGDNCLNRIRSRFFPGFSVYNVRTPFPCK